MFCSKCGSEITSKFCPSCGASVDNTSTVVNTEDKPSTGMIVLSFLIPIVGYIYYFSKRKEFPKKAEPCLYSAIGGSVVTLFMYL